MESQKIDKTDRTTGEQDHGPLQPFEHVNEEMRRATGWWWLYALLGLVSVALCVTALASRLTAVATLVAVLAVFLIYDDATTGEDLNRLPPSVLQERRSDT